MAINTNKRGVFGNLAFTDKPHGQPNTFTPKKVGMNGYNTLPDFPATERNANASLHNRAVFDNNPQHKLYLFVDNVSTGWKVAGETTQTHDSRTFYPRNLTQDDVVITGTVANNYEYDKLVRFVEHHQNSILGAEDFRGNYFAAVDFQLFKPANANTIYHTSTGGSKMFYTIAILSIEAGAERFKNAPTYTLRCKVLHDHLRGRSELDQAIDRTITYKEIFGGPKVALNKPHYTAKTAASKDSSAIVSANERESRGRYAEKSGVARHPGK